MIGTGIPWPSAFRPAAIRAQFLEPVVGLLVAGHQLDVVDHDHVQLTLALQPAARAAELAMDKPLVSSMNKWDPRIDLVEPTSRSNSCR